MMALNSSRHPIRQCGELVHHGHLPQTPPFQVFRNTSCNMRCLAEEPLEGSSTPEAAVSGPVSCGVPISSYNTVQALEAVTGKSFGCTMCGKCCSLADDAEVWLNDQEVDAIAAHLRISRNQVAAQYLQPYDQVPGWWLLQSKQIDGPWPFEQHLQSSTADHQQQRQVCVFLDASTNACSIYPVRPLQCSTYPWWPEIMPAAHWRDEQHHVCEGIEHPEAPALDRWHAAQQLQLATEHTLALEAAKPAGWDAEQQLYGRNSSNSSVGRGTLNHPQQQ